VLLSTVETVCYYVAFVNQKVSCGWRSVCEVKCLEVHCVMCIVTNLLVAFICHSYIATLSTNVRFSTALT